MKLPKWTPIRAALLLIASMSIYAVLVVAIEKAIR